MVSVALSSSFSSSLFHSPSLVLRLNTHTTISHPRSFTFTSPPPTPRGLRSVCFFNAPNQPDTKESGLDWPILRRWEVPWEWQTLSLTSLACGLGFVLTGLVEATALPYLGIRPELLTMDEKAELLFLDQGITTAVVLGIIYATVSTFQPLPQDFFKYDLRDPFSLQKGWLLWAGIGLVAAIASIALTGVAVSFFNGEPPQRETDALVKLLPLIGSSNISTACLVGITGVLAPVLEETLFRGLLMASMTKWVPTPVAIIIRAALGISYAQTRNLLTPITIHAFWNSGVILLLTFLLLQGYDIKELLQTS
ncbi:hypothetical protein PIB30_032187 [Stylosanthes scabra]|uniref:CAAX prenyl protease 2/Lysostaphin resistance protein A-like domain-containing protein n=1 Tax=Stylosanthes scabra TaxID=79078 RepID=A0ABU6RC94_9FABA|nr:hypothetical protein [Stylosanthes scabra]